MDLKDLIVYQIAMDIGEKVWNIVNEWAFFPKNNIGNQWVKSADSIAANISEGFGNFCQLIIK